MSLSSRARPPAAGSDKPVPDFMLWNAEPGAPTELCCINKASFLWLPFQSQWFGVLMGMILPFAIAFVLGTIVFRKRISACSSPSSHWRWCSWCGSW